MNTLHAPQTALPLGPSSSPSRSPSRSLAESCLQAARTWTTEPAMAPLHQGKTLWSELLRFGLHGAALGMVTGLSIVLFNKVAALLV